MDNVDSLSPLDVVELLEKAESERALARELGVHHSWVQRMRRRAESASDPDKPEMVSPVSPEDLALYGHSDFVNMETGELSRRWNKYKVDDVQRIERLNQAFEALMDRLPRHEPIPAPTFCSSRLCNLYTITDYHMGMYAHASMNGQEDWSTARAELYIRHAVEQMITMAPRAKKCVLNIQGDFIHNDSLWPVTPTSGHVLDQDCRYEVLIEIVMDVIERLIDLCLMHHEEVHVVIAEGNHDLSGTHVLRTSFNRIYRDEPRVTVDMSKTPYYAFRWGMTALFIHHGHKLSIKKSKELALLFATRFSEMWGAVKKRYGHLGHLHHEDVREESGIKLWQHPTLAPNDTHAIQEGYDSERGARFITYDNFAGEILSGRITPEMISI